MVRPLVVWSFLGTIRLVSILAAPAVNVPSASSFYVPQLPGLHEDPAHPLHIYAGHLPSDPNASQSSPTDVTAHLFFLLVKARRTADKERIIFWFNGGPGCSSFDGAMMEIGPLRVDGKGGLTRLDGSWEEYATVVFVDQPAGTGLSYVSTDKYIHELSDSAAQVVEFLRNFYDVFPEYRTMDTYLAGESYAGQYIPYIADAILSSKLDIPLRGAAIGNGWIDGRTQYASYVPFCLKMNLFGEGSEAHKKSAAETEKCMQNISDTYGTSGPLPTTVQACEDIIPGIIESLTHDVEGTARCINMYDVRLTDTSPACGMNWPSDLPSVTTYLRRQDVVSALHATAKSESWQECSGPVFRELHNNHSNASIALLPKLLQKMDILIFAGDQDLLCNHLGLEMMIDSMEWNGQLGLGDAKTQGWSVNGSDAGTWVEARNLTYTKIFNASHMVSWDVPHAAHDMILRFMRVDFSAITDGSAKISSNVGVDFKPLFKPVIDENQPQSGTTIPGIVKTPEQDKAKWEAYYNAGSAALVLVLIALAIGVFFWLRSRRHSKGVQLSGDPAEETIPLHSNRAPSPNGHLGDEDDVRRRKGKERESSVGETIFNVGDSEDDEEAHNR